MNDRERAIVMVDMPSNCRECPFYDTEIIPSCWANMSFRGRTIIYNESMIQHFCPLKPLPEKKEEVFPPINIEKDDGVKNFIKPVYLKDLFKYAVAKGYNEAIDEITGE